MVGKRRPPQYISGEIPRKFENSFRRSAATWTQSQAREDPLPRTALHSRFIPAALEGKLVPGAAFFLTRPCRCADGQKPDSANGGAYPLIVPTREPYQVFASGSLVMYIGLMHRDERKQSNPVSVEYSTRSILRSTYPVFLIDGARYLIADLSVLSPA